MHFLAAHVLNRNHCPARVTTANFMLRQGHQMSVWGPDLVLSGSRLQISRRLSG